MMLIMYIITVIVALSWVVPFYCFFLIYKDIKIMKQGNCLREKGWRHCEKYNLWAFEDSGWMSIQDAYEIQKESE